MAKGYKRSTEFKHEFDGDTITADIKPLSFEDSLKFKGVEVDAQDGATEKAVLGAIDMFRDVLPKYVVNFKGVTDADGAEVSFEEVLNTAYFIGVVSRMGTHLLKYSFPPAELNDSLPSDSTKSGEPLST
jgi:predicted AAA+ superfamily ATPase